jgi:hypothetical protein
MAGTAKHTLISRDNSIRQTLYIQNLPSRRRAAKSPFPYPAPRHSPQYHRRVLVVLLTEQGKCPSLAGTGSWVWRFSADHYKEMPPAQYVGADVTIQINSRLKNISGIMLSNQAHRRPQTLPLASHFRTGGLIAAIWKS